MKVTVIGVGLIGGSLALAIKEKGLSKFIVGVDGNSAHLQKALSLGLIDEGADLLQAVSEADLIIIAIPVDAAEKVLPQVLDNMKSTAVVMDVGSTKSGLVAIADKHANRKRFVATHPMWGTEYSGPEAAVRGAFANKAVVICNMEDSDTDAVEKVATLYQTLGMHLLYMNAAEHDLHAAYVSHVSHITSFALANTVLEKEREEDAIFELASGGFESTVRLAKSNAAMWVPIFKQNRENVLDVLNEHISQLRKFKACLEKENYDYLNELIQNANKIKRILK